MSAGYGMRGRVCKTYDLGGVEAILDSEDGRRTQRDESYNC